MMQDCCETSTGISNAEYLRQFNRKAIDRRIPLSGTLALTYRCNLACKHCYSRCAADHKTEMSTCDVSTVLSQCSDAGCLSLLLTGGEPLLRPDFEKIYTEAKQRGFLVTVFTNATLVDDRVASLLADLPPRGIEITLYGATDATYDSISGVPGSFRKCIAGIETLLARGVEVRIKTILMKQNRHEFEAMEAMAKGYGARFRFDACLFSRLDGDKAPLAFRVSPEEAVEKEFADPGRAKDWLEYHEKNETLKPYSKLYGCGAGVTGFYIDPAGCLFSCLMVRGMKYDLRDGTFADGWRRVVEWMNGQISDKDSACVTCDKKVLCGYCPGYFESENGSPTVKSEYLCAVGEQRKRMVDRERSARFCEA